MSLTKEYFDSIQIDLVKRKYYNANKVHAVFDDIQRQAQELIEENEVLRAMLAEKEEATAQASARSGRELEKLQQVYRDTLERARARSDALIRETEDSLRRQQKEAQESREAASRLLVEAVSMLKQREEENTDFLNRQLQKFMSAFDGTAEPEPVPAPEPESFPPEESAYFVKEPELSVKETEEDPQAEESKAGEQEELQRKVQALAQEIRELEAP